MSSTEPCMCYLCRCPDCSLLAHLSIVQPFLEVNPKNVCVGVYVFKSACISSLQDNECQLASACYACPYADMLPSKSCNAQDGQDGSPYYYETMRYCPGHKACFEQERRFFFLQILAHTTRTLAPLPGLYK